MRERLTISMLRLEALAFLWDFLLNRARRCLISLLVDSITNVRSLPKKCLSSGRHLKKPSHSSVTKTHFSSSICRMSFIKPALERFPTCQAIARRDIPSTALPIQILFFSIYKMPHLIHLNERCLIGCFGRTRRVRF